MQVDILLKSSRHTMWPWKITGETMAGPRLLPQIATMRVTVLNFSYARKLQSKLLHTAPLPFRPNPSFFRMPLYNVRGKRPDAHFRQDSPRRAVFDGSFPLLSPSVDRNFERLLVANPRLGLHRRVAVLHAGWILNNESGTVWLVKNDRSRP